MKAIKAAAVFPSITFPTETKQETGMRFLFFLERGRPKPKPGQREPFGGCNILFLLVFFSECKGREPDKRPAH
jgi:hypothetical protein